MKIYTRGIGAPNTSHMDTVLLECSVKSGLISRVIKRSCAFLLTLRICLLILEVSGISGMC